MADEKADLSDGTVDWSLGQDAWHSPDALQPNQFAAGVNVSVRGTNLQPRDAFEQIQLTFEDKWIKTDFGYSRPISEIWKSGKFQALIPFVAFPDQYLISIVCGLIFQTNIEDGSTVLLSESVKVNQYVSRLNWAVAEGAVVIFDFPDYPVIIKDRKVTRSDPLHRVDGFTQPQVPIANIGSYNQNRLFIANDGTEFTASDAVGDKATSEAPLTFSEVFTPSSPFVNQFFSLPTTEDNHPITAMGFIQQLDQNTGVGQLFISTLDKVFFCNTNQPRANWEQGQFSGLLLANAGMAGNRAFSNVNSDVIFVSSQGEVFAFSTARNEMKRWGNVPISREVKNYLVKNPELARVSAVGYFDNRIYITANPYRVQALDLSGRPVTDYAHGGFVVLELETATTLLAQGTPVWSGLWTGINPMEIANCDDKCFVASKDGNEVGQNAIYRINKNLEYDLVDGRERPIRSIVYTRQYTFQQEFTQKKEKSIAVHLQDLSGQVKLKIERKPSHSHEFITYGDWKFNAKTSTTDFPPDDLINGFAKQQIKHIVFGDGEQTGCSELNQDEYETFFRLQLRITLEGGHWQLNNIKLKARPVEYIERPENVCGELTETALPIQFVPDWLIPEESLCLT